MVRLRERPETRVSEVWDEIRAQSELPVIFQLFVS